MQIVITCPLMVADEAADRLRTELSTFLRRGRRGRQLVTERLSGAVAQAFSW